MRLRFVGMVRTERWLSLDGIGRIDSDQHAINGFQLIAYCALYYPFQVVPMHPIPGASGRYYPHIPGLEPASSDKSSESHLGRTKKDIGNFRYHCCHRRYYTRIVAQFRICSGTN